MNESDTQSLIRQQVGNGPVRLFRNNVGATKDAKGRLIRYGLAKGSADLIGWLTRKITQEDVGETIAQFVSIEVKSSSGKPRPDQIAWQDFVNQAGGRAGIARSVDDAEKIIYHTTTKITEK